MARFYDTSKTDYVDFLQEQQKSAAAAAADSSIASAFGDIKSIPEDREILSQVLSEYESEINQLTSELQADPRAMKRLEPRIASLRQRMAQDRQTGVLKAIEDRYNQDVSVREGIAQNLKTDPYQAARAAEEYRMNIPPLNFDPQTKTYNQIQPMAVAKPFMSEDWDKWSKANTDIIQSTLLEELSKKEGLDPYSTLYTRQELEGVTRDRAMQILARSITPDMVQAAEQQRRYYYGNQGDPEDQFIKNGQINLNTRIGQRLAATIDAVTRENLKTWRTVDEDEGRITSMQNRVQNQDAEWWARKLSSLYQGFGTDAARSQSEATAAELSSMLNGKKTQDGRVIQGVEINASTGKPMLVLKNVPKTPTLDEDMTDKERNDAMSRWRASITTTQIPFEVQTLASVSGFSAPFVGKIGGFAMNLPNWNRQEMRFEAQEPEWFDERQRRLNVTPGEEIPEDAPNARPSVQAAQFERGTSPASQRRAQQQAQPPQRTGGTQTGQPAQQRRPNYNQIIGGN